MLETLLVRVKNIRSQAQAMISPLARGQNTPTNEGNTAGAGAKYSTTGADECAGKPCPGRRPRRPPRGIFGTPPTTTNWNVNVLLDDLRHDVRHFHQFTTHLRHCDVENELEAAATVPLVPHLQPHLNERCRPGGKHVPVVVRPVVHRACRLGWRSRQAHGKVHLVSVLSPGPGCPLACGTVDAHLCTPQVCTEASLSPPSCGSSSRGVVNRRVNH